MVSKLSIALISPIQPIWKRSSGFSLLAVLGQLAAAVLRLLDQTHLLQVVDAVADEVAVGLFHQSYLKMAYVIMVSMAHAVAVLGTEGISQGVNTAGSHVEVASDGS